ncbi:hypothetical protein [Limnohabitans sp. Bal53]|uniref:hypothetical protein n=1 Tax=Limnohabitans sp. Bal53 TaxID=1977910 RepID=UPI000D3A0BBC|nr:hypothetical protein [Limnohabitans sp. Bal53]PUE41431.1 hypothetical protein B9Z50_06905 [Limnohabitans sp. Bal53]
MSYELDELDDDQDRAPDGRFVPGHSIKSPGAPRGLSPSEKVRILLEPDREAVVAKLTELAKLGDSAAQKLYLAYLAPAPKQESERIVIPGLADAATPKEKADCIIAAVAQGQMSFEAGERGMRLVSIYTQALIATDHEIRLAALEEGKLALLVDEKIAADAAKPPPADDDDICDLV